MAVKFTYGNYRLQGWLLATALLMPLTLGLACSAVSSDSLQPERHVTGPIGNATFEQLVIHSNTILIGTVADIAANKDSSGKDYRLVTLNVEQVLKGENPGQAVVRVPGDGNSIDTVKFADGEKVLILLDRGTGQFTIDGGVQGKFTIVNNMVNSVTLNEYISNIKSILARAK